MEYQTIYEEALRRAGITNTNLATGFPKLYENFKTHANTRLYRSPLCFTQSVPQSQFEHFEGEFRSLVQEVERYKVQQKWDLEREARELQAIRKEIIQKKAQKRRELEPEIKVIDECLGKDIAFHYRTRNSPMNSGPGNLVYTNWGHFRMLPWLPSGEEKFNDLDGLEAKIVEYKKMYAEVQQFRQEAVAIVEEQVKGQLDGYWNRSDEELIKLIKDQLGGNIGALGNIGNPYPNEENTSPTYWKGLVLNEAFSKQAAEETNKLRAYCETLYKRNKDISFPSVAAKRIEELEQLTTNQQNEITELKNKLNVLRQAFSSI